MARNPHHNSTRKKVTFKQKQFARKYVENKGNATQAALQVYDTNYDNAQVIGSENLNKPAVIDEINRLLESKGLNDDQYIAQNIKKVIDNGVDQKATAKEALNALNMLLKLKNSYPGKVSKTMKLSLHTDLSPQSVDQLTKTIEKFNITTQELLKDLKST